MASQQHIEKMQLRQNFRNLWHSDLFSTIQADTPLHRVYHICSANEPFTMICQDTLVVLVTCPAVVGVEKVNVLNSALVWRASKISFMLVSMSLYMYFLCLFYMAFFCYVLHVLCHSFLQVVCCFGNSVASTRFLLQDEFNIQTTQCDNCIIAFMFVLQRLACIFSIIALIVGNSEIRQASQLLSCLADFVYCTHKIEMDKRDGKFGPQSVMGVPRVQQMSRFDQQVPPFVGYAPQPAYGQGYGYSHS
ncbi:hypothetical protein GmHk_11G030850 [Glycine max]|nr:hypothetical protein GmHk_11G030850 [Glycine max]